MRVRPNPCIGETYKLDDGNHKIYFTVNLDHDNYPIETFLGVGKGGTLVAILCETIGRLLSLALKFGIPITDLSKQLQGIAGDTIFASEFSRKFLSIPDAIGYILLQKFDEYKKFTKEAQELATIVDHSLDAQNTIDNTSVSAIGDECPHCRNLTFIRQGGCSTCTICGHSTC